MLGTFCKVANPDISKESGVLVIKCHWQLVVDALPSRFVLKT
jgi:hypothetical protein